MASELANKVVKHVLENLSGRRGIGDELDACDARVRAELEGTLADIVDITINQEKGPLNGIIQ